MERDVPWSAELDWPADLSPFEPFDTAIQADPFRHYAWLRDHAPIVRAGRADDPLYIVSRFDDVTQGLRRTADFSSVPPGGVSIPGLLLILDPPEHGRLRHVVARAFTPRAMAALERTVEKLAAEHWQRMLDRRGGEVIAEFVTPMTMAVISTVLGIAVTDTDRMRAWTDEAVAYLGTRIRGVVNADATDTAYRAMRALMSEAMDRALAQRREDVISNIARLREEGSLAADEAAGFAVLLFMAGHETTTLLTANCLDHLAGNPAHLPGLRDGEAAGAFVDEMVRFRPSVHRLTRYVHRDVELAGHMIPAGSSVRFLVGSANRDPRRFADPDVFDPARANAAHAGFGYGIHMCIGSWLARMEVRLVLQRIAATTRSITRSGRWPTEPVQGGAFATVGLRRMGLDVEPGASPGREGVEVH